MPKRSLDYPKCQLLKGYKLTTVKLVVMVVVVVNFLNAKKTTKLSEISTAEWLEIGNSKVISISKNGNKLTYCMIQLDHPKYQS